MYKAKPWTMMKADISRLVPTITRFVQGEPKRSTTFQTFIL